MSQNIWLAFPALTAFLLQIWLFFNSNKRALISKSSPLILLFLSLLGICLIELLTYTKLLPPSLVLMKLYYISCFIGLTGIVIQANQLSHVSFIRTEYFSKFIFILCVLISISLLFSENIISGFEYISYSYTREPGPYYWVIQLFLVGMIFLSFSLLFIASRGEKHYLDSKRARVLLVAISPLILFGFILIPLMQVGVKINASVIFPIFTAYFLVVLIETEKREALFSILLKMPFSSERKSLRLITEEIQEYLISTEVCKVNGSKNIPLKSLTTSIENKIVDWTVQITNGSQVQAATLLGVSSSSICRKKKKG